MIVQDLIGHKDDFHTLLITGSDPVSAEVSPGQVIQCNDLRTMQEKVNTIIIQQVSRVAECAAAVVADDTDVFILLLHFCHHQGISCRVLMQPSAGGRSVVDISATAEKHKDILPAVLSAHAITGCNTVAATFGIGKLTTLSVEIRKACTEPPR